MSLSISPQDKSSSKSSVELPLKPIQPTQYWTFDNALSLLRNCQDPYSADALDEFLLSSKEILLNSSPFTSNNDKQVLNLQTKDISLRGILYTNISAQDTSDGKLLSNLLNIDVLETIRVICQTNKKIPCKAVPPQSEAVKSKLLDEKYYENKRLQLYTSKILRERRIILKIVVELLNNKSNSYASSTIQNLGKEIFLSKQYLVSLIESISKASQSLMKRQYITGINKEIDDTIHNETVLFCIEACKVLIELSVQNTNVDVQAVRQWFKLMRDTNYSVALGPYVSYHEAFSILQGLFTVLTIQYLDLNNSFDSVHESLSVSYMTDVQAFK